jgi:uncharacterized membrane protein YsdA (DUF1294 family)
MPARREPQKKQTPSLNVKIPNDDLNWKLAKLCITIIPLGGAINLHLTINDSLPLQWYMSLSLLSFCLYFLDKYRALSSGWRIRENTLLLIDLLGGWPGGYLSQQIWRHKTHKRSFQVVFWSIVVFHNVVWLYVYLDGR